MAQKFDEKKVKDITDRLFLLTSDLFVLITKTLRCHWNMKDTRFYFLHELLDDQYHQLLEHIDLVAERIGQLDQYVPASLQEFINNARLQELTAYPSGDEMIRSLVESYDQLITTLREDISFIDELHDPATSDMLTQLIRQYEKASWILRSHLE